MIGENVISYLNTFLKEFTKGDKQVDYDLQFSKSFLEPIKVIMDTIGWQPEKVHHWSLGLMTTKFIVSYQSIGFSAREEKVFDSLKEAQWFERAMKRSNFITNIMEVKGELSRCSKGDW